MGAFGEAAIYCAFEMDFSNILDFTLFISVWATAENANKRWIVIYLLWTHREYYIGVIAVCNAHCAVLSMANLSYSFMCLRSPMAIVFDWLKFKMIQNSGLESQRVDKREREKRACEKVIARKSEEKQKVSSVAKQTQKKKRVKKYPRQLKAKTWKWIAVASLSHLIGSLGSRMRQYNEITSQQQHLWLLLQR